MYLLFGGRTAESYFAKFLVNCLFGLWVTVYLNLEIDYQ